MKLFLRKDRGDPVRVCDTIMHCSGCVRRADRAVSSGKGDPLRGRVLFKSHAFSQ